MIAENMEQVKKQDRTALKKFIIIMVVCTLAGGVLGFSTAMIGDVFSESVFLNINYVIHITKPFTNFVLCLVFTSVMAVLYVKSKKMYRAWDGETEDVIERIEFLLSYALWASSMLMILSFFFFAAGIGDSAMQWQENHRGLFSGAAEVAFISGFLLSVICVVVAQQKIVNLEKIINPEKNGSVFDVRFSEKWLDSCDEAEQHIIYRASYSAYKSVTKTCITLWVICCVSMMIWDIGVLPVFLVSVIWLVQTSSYCLAVVRLTKRKS